jgi:hypothetical protein
MQHVTKIRRATLLVAGTWMALSVLGLAASSTAVASPRLATARVNPGGMWTVVDLPVNSCDDITFGASHTWTGGGGTGGNDSGVYKGGLGTITMTWKTGYYSTLNMVFHGRWNATQKEYLGTFTYTGGPSSGALVRGQQC